MFSFNLGRPFHRLLPPLLALTVALSAAIGCSKPQEPPKPSFQGTLTLWTANGLAGQPAAKPDQAFFDERARLFEQQNSGVTVVVRTFPTPQALEQAVMAAPAAGETQPDLIFGRFLRESPRVFAQVGPLLTQQESQDYLPNALEAFRRGEQHDLGLPVLLEVHGLALNEQSFLEAGVSLPQGGRWNLDEFENSLRNLSKDSRFGLGFYHLPGYHEWWPLADGLLTTHSGIMAPGSLAGMQRLTRYRQEGLLHPDTAKLKAEATWQLFARGKIAIMPVSGWAVPLLRQDPYAVKLAVAGFPGGTTDGYTYGFTFPQQEDQARLKAAVALARLVGAPDQQVRLARETGLVPASKSAGNPFDGDPQMTRLYELAGQQRSLPAGPLWETLESQFSRELLLALIGAREPDKALTATQKLIMSAIAPK